MAFNTIPSSLIAVGKSITRTLWSTYVKDNLDDLNSRITTVEGSTNKVVLFDEIVINAASADSFTGLDYYRVQSSFSITDAKVYIFEKGALTGTLEMDIQKSTTSDFTSSVSVFTTKPSIDYSTASSYDESGNVVFDGTNKDVVEGDYLRLDISSLPTNGTISKIGIYVIGEA